MWVKVSCDLSSMTERDSEVTLDWSPSLDGTLKRTSKDLSFFVSDKKFPTASDFRVPSLQFLRLSQGNPHQVLLSVSLWAKWTSIAKSLTSDKPLKLSWYSSRKDSDLIVIWIVRMAWRRRGQKQRSQMALLAGRFSSVFWPLLMWICLSELVRKEKGISFPPTRYTRGSSQTSGRWITRAWRLWILLKKVFTAFSTALSR